MFYIVEIHKRNTITMLVVFATIIALGAATPDKTTKYSTVSNGFQITKIQKSDSPCETPECIHAASTLLRNMDERIDPCDDFYQFACGKFDTEYDFTEPIKKQMRPAMIEEIKENDPKAFKLMKSYYNICMSGEPSKQIEEKDLREMLKKFGGWPVLEGPSWNETDFDWKKSVHQMSEIGFDDDMFVSVEIVSDNYNSSRRIIRIKQGYTNILPEEITNNTRSKDFQGYFEKMVNLAVYLGADRNQAEKDLSGSLDFEIELAKISGFDRKNTYHLSGKLTTLQMLDSNYKGILWSEYINDLIAPHAHVDQDDKLLVESPSFMEALTKLIISTPKRTIANYMLWRFAHAEFPVIPTPDKSNIASCNSGSNKWSRCLDDIFYNFGVAASSFYVRRFFNESIKSNVFSMAGNIKNIFHQLIYQSDWMDDETKSLALEKLNSIKQNIAYPNELLSDEKLNEYYRNVKLYPESYYKSKLSLKKLNREKEFSSLGESVEELFWVTLSKHMLSISAQYHQENVIIIPAGYIQGRNYNNDRPNYMNYGGIGRIIAHEMTHAFGPQARLFDKTGNLANWWKNETAEKYLEKANCIIEQYNNYHVAGINMTINGTASLSENMADIFGLKASYYAYNQLINDIGAESRLPGLQYTPQQLFWISATHSLCQTRSGDDLKLLLTYYPYSPEKFRVMGPMSNLPEFSKDFQCPLGSPMNPVKKCSMW